MSFTRAAPLSSSRRPTCCSWMRWDFTAGRYSDGGRAEWVDQHLSLQRQQLLLSGSAAGHALRGPAAAEICRRRRHARPVLTLVADRRGAQRKRRLFRCLEVVGRRSIHGVDHRRRRQLRLADAYGHVGQLVRAIARTELRAGPQRRRQDLPVTTNVDTAGFDHPGPGRGLLIPARSRRVVGSPAALRRRVRGGRSVRPVDAARRGAQ